MHELAEPNKVLRYENVYFVNNPENGWAINSLFSNWEHKTDTYRKSLVIKRKLLIIYKTGMIRNSACCIGIVGGQNSKQASNDKLFRIWEKTKEEVAEAKYVVVHAVCKTLFFPKTFIWFEYLIYMAFHFYVLYTKTTY